MAYIGAPLNLKVPQQLARYNPAPLNKFTVGGRARFINDNAGNTTFNDSAQVDNNQVSGNTGGGGGYSTGGGGGGGGGAPAYNPADMAYLDDQIGRLQRQHQSANSTLSSGLSRLQDSYNQQQSQTNQQRSRTLEDFALKNEDTARSKNSALGKVDTNARTLAESLRRRIGMASGSGSSAYQVTAPGAVARDASENRTGIQENFGINFRNLKQSEDRAKSDYETLLQDLEGQFKSRTSDFRASILDKQNQIDNSLSEVARQKALLRGGGYDQVKAAMSPYASAIDSRQNELDGLFDKYRTPYNVKAVEVKTPTLRDYVSKRGEIGAAQNSQQEDPFFNELLRRDDEEQAFGY